MNWILIILLGITSAFQLEQDPKEIIRKADEKVRGDHVYAEMKMKIIRPEWTREISMKSWGRGTDYALILITAPARDKGTAFLKRGNEIWNWQPTIDRVVNLPPSMMMQSWMGSDFTNDDLVKESSMIEDYTHELVGKEEVNGRMCYKIKMIPKEEAAVVWGEVYAWISVDEYLQMKVEFYDEDGYLVNTMYGKDISEIGGKTLPRKLEVIPADEDDQKTVVEYETLTFNKEIPKDFFSIQNMKRLR